MWKWKKEKNWKGLNLSGWRNICENKKLPADGVEKKMIVKKEDVEWGENEHYKIYESEHSDFDDKQRAPTYNLEIHNFSFVFFPSLSIQILLRSSSFIANHHDWF